MGLLATLARLGAGLLLVVYVYALVYAVIRFALEVLYVVPDPRIRY